MKKTILFISLIIAISANAQFVGNFYHADPNAVFDKEPYFACLNNYTYMGYGQNIQNITVIINDEYVYSYPYIWNYGYWLVLGNENGFEFSSFMIPVVPFMILTFTLFGTSIFNEEY